MPERMQNWSKDAIRFMRAASEYAEYHARLAERIASRAGAGAYVLDAGCGLGYLSLALAGRVRRVAACDVNGDALRVLRENAAARGTRNLDILRGDAFALDGARFDDAVFWFFGKKNDILRAARKLCDDRVFVIGEHRSARRFSLTDAPPRRESTAELEAALERLGVPFETETFSLEFGQPFASFDDAVAFFALYNDEAPDHDAVAARLVPDPKGRYAFYLPLEKKLGMTVFSARDVPDGL